MKADEWNHAPESYDCPFCRFAGGSYDSLNASTDLVATTMHAFARVSPKWWPNNRGHVIVAPVEHFENLYALPSVVGLRFLISPARLRSQCVDVERARDEYERGPSDNSEY